MPQLLRDAGFSGQHTPEDDIRARLTGLGLRPEDIKIVINSHFHRDHADGNRLFPHARFLVQASEQRFACCPDPFIERPYAPSYFQCDIPYEFCMAMPLSSLAWPPWRSRAINRCSCACPLEKR